MSVQRCSILNLTKNPRVLEYALKIRAARCLALCFAGRWSGSESRSPMADGSRALACAFVGHHCTFSEISPGSLRSFMHSATSTSLSVAGCSNAGNTA